VASISTVRCAGTPHPLNKAYAAASTAPPANAACCAGQARQARGLRRHRAPVTSAASHANIVMCRPEMLIRWATPVARKMSQSVRSIAFWSPTASAASTPAIGRSGTCA